MGVAEEVFYSILYLIRGDGVDAKDGLESCSYGGFLRTGLF